MEGKRMRIWCRPHHFSVMEQRRMGLIAVWDTALGPLSAVLCRVSTLKVVETQSLR